MLNHIQGTLEWMIEFIFNVFFVIIFNRNQSVMISIQDFWDGYRLVYKVSIL